VIETMKVIRCDASVDLPARPPRPGMGRFDGQARTVQCSRHFPIRTALPAAWEAARKRGWRQGRNANGRTMQFCPDHAAEHAPHDHAEDVQP
jgi:hypothetical protein